ncbi:MAG: hypothetical protein ACE5OZ_09895 [Candidatus Heimdallarchaeota archaeon]
MMSDQLNYFGLDKPEFEFNLPEKVESILLWEFFDYDHRIVAKMNKVSPYQYAQSKMQQMAKFFGHLSPLRYVGSLRVPTEEFLNLFLANLPFPPAIDLNETEIDENEFKLIMALMTLFPLEEPSQRLSIFVSSHLNGDIALVCIEVEPGIFICLSVCELPENSVLWESQLQWQPQLLYCPQVTTLPTLFS